MSITPRAGQWLKMAEDARAKADGMRDPDGRQMMLDIADSYEKLATWAEKAADRDGLHR